MKTRNIKITGSVTLLLAWFFLSLTAFSQQLINHSFESWSTLSFFKEPVGYHTTNFQSFLTTGYPNVMRVTDSYSGTYAAMMQTIDGNGELIPAGIFIGNPGPYWISGGIPYSDIPDTLSFWAKYNIYTDDTAQLMLIFKYNGNPMGFASAKLTGISAAYTNIRVKIDWFRPQLNPDTLCFIVLSSLPDLSPANGSYIIIDKIELLHATQQLPNPDFENWLDLESEEPDGWFTSNLYSMFGSGASASKSTDHIDGLYSVQLTNAIMIGGDTISFITNGMIGDNGPSGGTPISQNPLKMTFYYKYEPVGADTAIAMGILWKFDPGPGVAIILDSVQLKLQAAATWTYHEMIFNYAGFPPADTVTIAFSAGNIGEDGNYVGLGSNLWIDNLILEYGPIGMTEVEKSPARLFPNPVKDQIALGGNEMGPVTIEMYTSEGKLLKTINIIPGSHANVSDLPSGQYLYRIISEMSVVRGKFVKL